MKVSSALRQTAVLLMVGALMVSAILLSACSNSNPSDTSQAASEATTEPAPTTPEAAGATPEPTPAPTPTPTPEPEPEPIFTRVVLPEKAVSEPDASLRAAVAPRAEFGWLGVGNWYSRATDNSLPVYWEFQDDNRLDYTLLPVAPESDGGNADEVVVVDGRQIAGGQLYESYRSQAALWIRESDEAPWETLTGFVDELPDHHAGESWVLDLEAGDGWAMMLLLVESNTELDDEGNPAQTRYLYRSEDGLSWTLVELPHVDMATWRFDLLTNEKRGAIAAADFDPDDPQARLFVTEDAGITWQGFPVAVSPGRSTSIRDVLWEGDEMLVGGSVEVDGSDRAAIFEFGDDEQWHPKIINMLPVALYKDQETALAFFKRLHDGSLAAVIDMNSGSRTVIRTDSAWLTRDALWINQYDSEGTDVAQLVQDPTGDRMLVVRTWQPPVWFNNTSVSVMGTRGFDGENRTVHYIIGQEDGFVLVSHEPATETTKLWHSADGEQWRLETTDEGYQPVGEPSDTGEGLLMDVDGPAESRTARYYSPGGPLELPWFSVFEVPESATLSIPFAVASTGRTLVTADVIHNDVKTWRHSFVKLDNDAFHKTFEVPYVGSELTTICPQLDTGEFAILRSAQPANDTSTIQVWGDRPTPIVGAGFETVHGYTFPGAAVDCELHNDVLLAAGTTCPALEGDTTFELDKCDANLWLSPDGYRWTEHPARAALVDAGIRLIERPVGTNRGWLLYGEVAEGTDDELVPALWLATSDLILRVPIDDTRLFGDLDVDQFEAVGDSVLIRDASSIFIADLDYLVERTFAAAGLPDSAEAASPVIEFTSAALPSGPIPDWPAPTLIEDSGESAPQPTPAPRPTAPPSAAPAPTPFPTPVPTAPPTTSDTVPQCAPGALTTTGQCRCSGGRLYDDGGQCKVRCSGSEQPDGFGGCVRADGTEVDPGTSAGGGSVLFQSCVTINSATGESEPCDDN